MEILRPLWATAPVLYHSNFFTTSVKRLLEHQIIWTTWSKEMERGLWSAQFARIFLNVWIWAVFAIGIIFPKSSFCLRWNIACLTSSSNWPHLCHTLETKKLITISQALHKDTDCHHAKRWLAMSFWDHFKSLYFHWFFKKWRRNEGKFYMDQQKAIATIHDCNSHRRMVGMVWRMMCVYM